jgi:hypothetical protein
MTPTVTMFWSANQPPRPATMAMLALVSTVIMGGMSNAKVWHGRPPGARQLWVSKSASTVFSRRKACTTRCH